MPASDFQHRTVLITGASAGVGKAAAEAFHAAGANVVLMARTEAPLRRAAEPLERAHWIAVDVADTTAMSRAIAESAERFGAIHGLVNNAGAHFRGALEKRSVDEIAAMVDVNLRAPLVLTRMVLPWLRQQGGFIVNVASLAGKVPLDGAATYSATKFGLRAFTIAMAQELCGSGITVSAVSPGPIDTGFIMDDIDEVEDIVFSQTLCSAADVANMILACARDGKLEREFPVGGAKLATLGYLIPELRRTIKPFLNAKGRRVKEQLRKSR
ncbi:MAG: SDR family NAD(P)-dependent oxidoreductase, partial [Myxococcales bacterium]|nr:SDR family NAD(P)-dependent oxidoreductase [Myxococcales bacterium]